jgi:hypothetical protein
MRLPSEDSLTHEQAAIALAVVSTKAGQLNLDRTLWAMRRVAEPKPEYRNGGQSIPRWWGGDGVNRSYVAAHSASKVAVGGSGLPGPPLYSARAAPVGRHS